MRENGVLARLNTFVFFNTFYSHVHVAMFIKVAHVINLISVGIWLKQYVYILMLI